MNSKQQSISRLKVFQIPESHSCGDGQDRQVRPTLFRLLSAVQSSIERKHAGTLQGNVVDIPCKNNGLDDPLDSKHPQPENESEDQERSKEEGRPAQPVIFSILVSKIKREGRQIVRNPHKVNREYAGGMAPFTE